MIDAREIDGVTGGTWILMQFLGMGAFTVTNEMGDQEALDLWDRL